MTLKLKIICFYQLISTFLINNINYNWHIEQSDDHVIDQVCEALQIYNLAIYKDDVNSWENPLDLEKIVIYEIKQATSFLKIDNLLSKNLLINYQKMQLKNDYKLDLAKQTLLVNLQYGNSKIKEFKFHAWPIKREDIITAINKKIDENVYIYKIFEDNWQSTSYLSNLGNYYLTKLVKVIGSSIIIKDYKIPINFRRIFFESWSNLQMSKYQIILQYRYFFNTPLILWTLNLKHIVNYEKIIPKLTEILRKSNFLNIKIDGHIPWNDKINWLEIINTHLLKWKIAINSFLEKFKYEQLKFTWKISSISPFGPFDQDVTLFLSLDSSLALIPLQISFDNKIDQTQIEKLEKSITDKLAKLFILFEKAQTISFKALKNILRKNIGNEITINNELIPFDIEKLEIRSWTIAENKLIINTRLKNNVQIITIKINLI